MAQENTEEKVVIIDEALSKTEQFIIDNKKILTIIGSIIVGLIIIFVFIIKFYLPSREKEAQAQMYVAEKYFEKDSLKYAINGDGNYPGFLEIIDKYSFTKSANLAKYYVGMCYLKKGEFDNAIKYLNKFSSNDLIVSALAQGGIGDAYMELGKTEDAISHYLKAANDNPNDFVSPIFLMKAALAYEDINKFKEALEIYQKIKKDFPKSNEARQADKYIAKVKAQAGIE
jgi:tetratricopeptide (TPR) repeat protein